jgi:hypothetical protein
MIPTLFVHSPPRDACWICGSRSKPSREHKFKASDLRRHFGKGKLHVAPFGETPSNYKIAQGMGSNHLKFKSSICEWCNSSVTQESDRAYDQFIAQLEIGDANAEELFRAFSVPMLPSGPKYHSVLPIFRYFAKILGCQLADAGAPIPRNLSRFVAKRTNKNCIWLAMRRDSAYEDLSSLLAEERPRYAAHGGLVVITKKPNLLPSRLYTTLTIGPIQFTFFFVLKSVHVLEMQLRFPTFVKWCAEVAQQAAAEPLAPNVLRRLGLESRREEK